MARYIYRWENTEHGRRLFRVPSAAAPARTTAKSEPATTAPAEPNYGSLKKDELVALAEERNVDSSGTKAEIIERLEQDDG